MDINMMDQGLLRRNPAMTQDEFSNHWFAKHAPLVVPFFLHSGISQYEQIHPPLQTHSPTLSISSYDGVAGMPPASALVNLTAGMPKWKADYYREVILADERRFLISEALDHIVRVGPGTVSGERKVVIRDGRCEIPVAEGVWRVWREFEAKGKGEERAEGETKEAKKGETEEAKEGD